MNLFRQLGTVALSARPIHVGPHHVSPVRGNASPRSKRRMRLTLPLLVAVAGAATVAASSSPRVIRVVTTNYAFIAPDTVAAGPVEFALENRGKVRHEVVLRALRPGVGASQIVEAAKGSAQEFASIIAEGTSFGLSPETRGPSHG